MANKLYEKFHENTSSQARVIDENDFTYQVILPLLIRYQKFYKRVLDIGCGAGNISFFLASRGNDVVGVDISQNAVQACINSARQLKLSNKTNFLTASFPGIKVPGKFSLVIMSEVLEHLKDDQQALREIYQLLVPSGVLIITVPSSSSPMHRLKILFLGRDGFDERVGHLRRYKLNELVQLVGGVGFTVKESGRSEGLVRNFLFVTSLGNRIFPRYYRPRFKPAINLLDKLSLIIFGESQLELVATKPR